jgi:hypothetical protein
MELENYFEALELPKEPIQINKFSRINSVKNFIDSHLEIITHNNGNRTFTPYYDRLIDLISFLSALRIKLN